MARPADMLRRCQYNISPQVHRRRVATACVRGASSSPQRRQAAAEAVAAAPATAPTTAAAVAVPAKRFTDIPGPLALPMLRHSAYVLPRIGNFHHVVGLGLLEGIRKRYGDLVRLAKGARKRPVLYVFDPELMRQVYESEATEIPYWQRSPLETQRQQQNNACPLHRDETKKVWAAMKTLLQDGSLYDRAFDDIATDVTRRLEDLRQTGGALNQEIETEMYRWALETLGVVVFGRRIGCLDGAAHVRTPDDGRCSDDSPKDGSTERCSLLRRPLDECTPAEQLVRCSREIADVGYIVRSEVTLKSDSKTFNNALQAFDLHFGLVEGFLTSSLKGLDSNDEPETLLLRRLRPLDNHLLPLAADVILAGVDAMAHSAVAMLYQFSLHAARQQRAHDEIGWRCVADSEGSGRPTELPYLAACVKEALRLHPATGGVVRRTIGDLVLGGYHVPVGVDIVLAHGVSSRSEDQWGRARTFLPERWHSQGWESVPQNTAHSLATLPFGTNCPAGGLVGRMLASLAARVLEKYRLEWHGPAPNLYTYAVNKLQTPYYFVLQKAA